MIDDADAPVLTLGTLAPVLVDRDGLALMLSVSPRTVSRLDDTGRIPPALPLGGCKRWSVDEIQAWARAGGPSRAEWMAMRGSAA